MNNQQIAQKNLKDKANIADQSYEDLRKEADKGIDRLDKFYLYLTSLSTGSIMLSVTFLGDFVDKFDNVPFVLSLTNYHLLYLAWLFLFLAMFSGLARVYNHISYSHTARHAHWLKTTKEQKELEKDFLEKYPEAFVNIEDANMETLQKNIDIYNAQYKKDKKKTSFHIKMTDFFEASSRITFVLGIILLIFFAILSLNNLI